MGSLPAQSSSPPSSPVQQTPSKSSNVASLEIMMSDVAETSPSTLKALEPSKFNLGKNPKRLSFKIKSSAVLGKFSACRSNFAKMAHEPHTSEAMQQPWSFDGLSKLNEVNPDVRHDVKMLDVPETLSSSNTTSNMSESTTRTTPELVTEECTRIDHLPTDTPKGVFETVDAAVKAPAGREKMIETELDIEAKNQAKRIAALKKHEAAVEAQSYERKRVKHLQAITADPQYYRRVRLVTYTVTEIIRYWILSAKQADEQPLIHGISFGERKGERLTIQLKQVLALFPDNWQHMLHVEPSSTYETDSWLDENLMNVLVHLGFPLENEDKNVFGLSLGSSINDQLNCLFKEEKKEQGCKGYLDHLFKEMLPQLPDPVDFKAEVKIFTFPPDTERIVWFWNYDGIHWTTVETLIGKACWSHRLYDSMEPNGRLCEWGSYVVEDFCFEKDLLETIITAVSGFPEVPYLSNIYKGATPRQMNMNDCGVFTVYNTLCLLSRQSINMEVTGHECRAELLDLVLRGLQEKFGEQFLESYDKEEAERFTYGDIDCSVLDPELPKPANDNLVAESPSFYEIYDEFDLSSAYYDDNSSEELQDFIQPTSPEPEMITVEFEKVTKPTTMSSIASVLNAAPNLRSLSPETVNIFTPTSSPVTPAHGHVQAANSRASSPASKELQSYAAVSDPSSLGHVDKTSSSPMNQAEGLLGDNMDINISSWGGNFDMIRGSTSLPKRVKSVSISMTNPSLPSEDTSSIMRMSCLSSTAQRSSPPVAQDPNGSQPSQSVCTLPPLHDVMLPPSSPSPIPPTECDPFALFPSSKNMTMEDVKARFSIMNRMRDQGLLTTDNVARIKRSSEGERLRVLGRLLQTCKNISDE